MEVFDIYIPDKALTNFDILYYVKELHIPYFRGVFMRDNLPETPWEIENGVVNFNRLSEPGTHWVCYHKNGDEKIYFDSYGQVMLAEVKNYLGSSYRNTDIVQAYNSKICGHLCLFVLKALSNGWTFREVLNHLTTQGGGIQWTSTLANELHKTVRKKFLKRFVFVREMDDVWASDLIDLRDLSRKNSGFKYILMIIDVFSKYGWAIPLRTKTGEEVSRALESLFQKEKCKKLWVDRGREYYNQHVLALLKKNNIQIYSTHNDEKCSVVERWNRTIKTKLWKYFSANNTQKYVDILPALIKQYNDTKHRSIGTTPTEARKPENYQQVFKTLYFGKVQSRNKEPKYSVGDQVRISVKKNIFEKGYTINWSDKIYTIDKIKKSLPPTYILKDDRGEVIEGTFYEEELQKTNTNIFRIEKVLQKKKIRGEDFLRVKWKGYDNSYNSWIPATDLDGGN